jgi:hypothetical protein|mmetsp:Transcript_14768/g.26711  ORF Transcript_14768/g.26711 Transcript_14768/m.26711 type:complete len:126 (+) Transcript_14768:1893-2270(+)
MFSTNVGKPAGAIGEAGAIIGAEGADGPSSLSSVDVVSVSASFGVGTSESSPSIVGKAAAGWKIGEEGAKTGADVSNNPPTFSEKLGEPAGWANGDDGENIGLCSVPTNVEGSSSFCAFVGKPAG